MTKCVLACGLLLAFVAPVEQPSPQVRDHREVPGAAAQWKIDGGEVDSVDAALVTQHGTPEPPGRELFGQADLGNGSTRQGRRDLRELHQGRRGRLQQRPCGHTLRPQVPASINQTGAWTGQTIGKPAATSV